MSNEKRVDNPDMPNLTPRRHNKAKDSRKIVTHPLVKGMPKIGLAVQPAIDSPERLDMAKRLLASYKVTKAAEKTAKLELPNDDLWTNLINNEFKQLLQILDAADVAALSHFLLHFGESYTWFGGLTLSIDGFNQVPDAEAIAVSYLDKLVCLAEYLGVLPLENPEQLAAWGENIYVDVNEILAGIEKTIGIPVATPTGAVPVTGIQTNQGPLHYRHFNSLYAALRIQALLPENGRLCEYGGGLGIVAYYANKLGFKDYTTFDLPLINIFSGHFLMNTLGAQAVGLYGEDSSTAEVKIRPYWQCMDEPDEHFTLSLNQDSFPEIDPSLVRSYMQQIQRTTTKYFLSINQEAQAPMGTRKQNSVQELMHGFADFRMMYRMKYWIREGYLEELYTIQR